MMLTQISHQNEAIAEALDQVADLLDGQQASPFRVQAYRKAARTIREDSRDLAAILAQEGIKGLTQIPGIGNSIGSAVAEFISTGSIAAAGRMESDLSPEALLGLVPGIGPKLAHRLVRELQIHTLEALEVAAHDGRLEALEGFGSRRTQAIRQHLQVMLGRASRLRATKARKRSQGPENYAYDDPQVSTLLALDAAYRKQASAGLLRKIAPRRFNPTGEAWLPLMQTERDGWLFTVMYSNTARAHELGRTDDWVIIFFEKQGSQHSCTIVSEWQGVLTGKRVIRGRESECLAYYTRPQA